jgi:hypothetical protein
MACAKFLVCNGEAITLSDVYCHYIKAKLGGKRAIRLPTHKISVDIINDPARRSADLLQWDRYDSYDHFK